MEPEDLEAGQAQTPRRSRDKPGRKSPTRRMSPRKIVPTILSVNKSFFAYVSFQSLLFVGARVSHVLIYSLMFLVQRSDP